MFAKTECLLLLILLFSLTFFRSFFVFVHRIVFVSPNWTIYFLRTKILQTLTIRYNLCWQTMVFVISITESISRFSTHDRYYIFFVLTVVYTFIFGVLCFFFTLNVSFYFSFNVFHIEFIKQMIMRRCHRRFTFKRWWLFFMYRFMISFCFPFSSSPELFVLMCHWLHWFLNSIFSNVYCF